STRVQPAEVRRGLGALGVRGVRIRGGGRRFREGVGHNPQKRNPDVAELARAQAGRVLGDLVTLATVLKGLPLAYDRDLQQDKPPVFDAFDALAPAFDAMTGMVSTLSFDTERMREATGRGFILAT